MGRVGLAAIAGFCAAGGTAAHAQVLYNGAGGTTPEAMTPQWLAFGTANPVPPFTPVATDAYVSGYTDVNSAAANSIYAGYSNYNTGGALVNAAFPTLNSAAGFTLSFTVRNASDLAAFSSTHPRSELSVIVLDSNHTGVEIGIRPDQIFAQASDFNSAAATSTTALGASLTSYTLAIQGTAYTLKNAGTTIISGSTTQFTPTGADPASVYTRNNFLYFGDDTTSDGGNFDIAAASITANAAPEPDAAGVVILGLGVVGMMVRRRRSVDKLPGR